MWKTNDIVIRDKGRGDVILVLIIDPEKRISQCLDCNNIGHGTNRIGNGIHDPFQNARMYSFLVNLDVIPKEMHRGLLKMLKNRETHDYAVEILKNYTHA